MHSVAWLPRRGLQGCRFIFHPDQADTEPSEPSEPCGLQYLCLVTLEPNSLTDKEHADYETRVKRCKHKKWRWCAHLGLGLG